MPGPRREPSIRRPRQQKGRQNVLADTRLKIAVFIDFDNIEIGVKSTLGAQFDIGVVLEALKERGDVVSKIAYGDWTRAGDYSRSLTQHATKLVQRNLTPGGDKNGADINLALDALEMAFTHSHINAYVIVGGDSDFITLVEKLKQYDKQIFVVGGRAFTSLVMQRNCHEFIAYENLVGSRRSGRSRTADRPGVAQASIEQAVPLVRRALKVLTDREVSPQLGLLEEHAAAARLDVLRAHLRRQQLPRFRAEARVGRPRAAPRGRAQRARRARRGRRPSARRRCARRSRRPNDATPRVTNRTSSSRATVRRRAARRPTGSAKCAGSSSRRRTRRAGRCTSGRRSSSCATWMRRSTSGSSGSPASSICSARASATGCSASSAIARASCACSPATSCSRCSGWMSPTMPATMAPSRRRRRVPAPGQLIRPGRCGTTMRRCAASTGDAGAWF